MKKNYSILLGIVVSVWVTPSISGNSFDLTGEISNKNSTQVIPIDDTHVIIKLSNQGMISTVDPKNPLNTAVGSCSGTTLLSMGDFSGGGYCTYKDSAGDTVIISFDANSLSEKGVNTGTWMLVGGTGKFSGSTGGGDYRSTPNEDGTESVNQITGNMVLK